MWLAVIMDFFVFCILHSAFCLFLLLPVTYTLHKWGGLTIQERLTHVAARRLYGNEELRMKNAQVR
jgi:hypothetical protein